MKGKIVSAIVLTLLLTSMLMSAFNIQPAKASGTNYIRADGSIYPPAAPISTADNVTYTFSDNIIDSIVVERDNIAVDGAGYTVIGPGETPTQIGIDLSERFNVTIENMVITEFEVGIYLNNSVSCNVIGNNIKNSMGPSVGEGGVTLHFSSNNSIVGNQISNWGSIFYGGGILLFSSSNNSILGNYLADTGGLPMMGGGGSITLSQSSSNNKVVGNNIVHRCGISAVYSSNYNNISENSLDSNIVGLLVIGADHNNIFRNNVTASTTQGMLFSGANYNDIAENSIKDGNSDPDSCGMQLSDSSNNTIVENNIVNNTCGIQFSSSPNRIYHNNFIRNALQAVSDATEALDNGYPSGGNYWSDYEGIDLYRGPQQKETGSDGIGDTPYVIDEDNQDNYPLMKPYPWDPHDVGITSVTTSKNVVGQGFNVSINASVFNYGDSTENFNVTIYANSTAISEISNVELASRNSTTITFTWNTTGFAMGNYNVIACATPVSGETDTTDNNSTGCWVLVTILGDVDGDFEDGHYDVDLFDAVRLLACYGAKEGDSNFDPNCDIDNCGQVFLFDAVILLSHYGQKYP